MDRQTNNEAWGMMAVRGLLVLLFGFAAVFWPGLTLVTVVYLFAGLVLASGIVTLVGALTNMFNNNVSFFSRALMMLLGAVEIGVGVYLLRHPLVSFATFILLVGFTLIFMGLVDAVQGLFEGGSSLEKTVMVVGGAVSVVAGVLLLFQPASSGVAFVWILGIFALITGPMHIALAMDYKNAPAVASRSRR